MDILGITTVKGLNPLQMNNIVRYYLVYSVANRMLKISFKKIFETINQ